MVIGFFIGVILGGVFAWVISYKVYPYSEIPHLQLKELMRNSRAVITEENWSCEKIADRTFGGVLSYMVSENMHSERNRLGYGCINETCSLTLSYCKPWQTSECSSLILKFEMLQSGLPKQESVSCILIP